VKVGEGSSRFEKIITAGGLRKQEANLTEN
jgi:hypothetical protein